jgi:hypothetical protein
MPTRHCIAVLCGLSLGAILSAIASAQQNDPGDAVYQAARNKIGLLRHCRDKGLLEPDASERAAEAVRAGLLRFSPSAAGAERDGDLAEAAGEAGFWEASRKRDLASVAAMLRITPAGLCREWAEETLRFQKRSPIERPQAEQILARPVAPKAPPLPAAAAQSEMPELTPELPTRAPASLARSTNPPRNVVPTSVQATPPASERKWESTKWRFDGRERPWRF